VGRKAESVKARLVIETSCNPTGLQDRLLVFYPAASASSLGESLSDIEKLAI
jgi:hypothetical protein